MGQMEIQNYHHENHQNVEETIIQKVIDLLHTIFLVEFGNLVKKFLHISTTSASAASQRTFSILD